MDKYIAAIDGADALRPLSKKQYIGKLRNLVDKVNHDVDWILRHPTATMASLDRQGLSLRTRKAYVDSIMAVFKYFDDFADPDAMLEYYEKWHQVFIKLREQVNDIYADNEPNERQQEAYVEWDEVLRQRDAFPDGSDERLLLAIYSYIPPARADYGQVPIYEGRQPTDEEVAEYPNYIVITTRGKVTLTLGEYKTVSTYGTLTRTLPTELAAVIRKSLKMRPRQFLFTTTRSGEAFADGQAFAAYAAKLLNGIFDKPTTINTLRHSFINSLDLNKLTVRQENEIARGLMHSFETLRRYRFVRG